MDFLFIIVPDCWRAYMNRRKKAKIFGDLFKDAYYLLSDAEKEEIVEHLQMILYEKVKNDNVKIETIIDDVIKTIKNKREEEQEC